MAAGEENGEETVRLQSSEGETFEVSLKVAKVSRTLATMLEDLGHQPGDVIPLPNVNSHTLKKVLVASSPGHSQILSRSRGEKSGEGLGSKLCHRLEMVNSVLAWAEHNTSHQEQPAPITPPSHPNPPSSPTSTPSPSMQGVPPFQPRPQPRVPQRTSRRVQPPPGHTLTQWEKDFITKNRDDVYELLLAANYLDIKGLLDILCRTVAETIRGKDPEQIRRTFHASDPSNIQPYPPPHAQQDTEQDTQAHQQPRETEV